MDSWLNYHHLYYFRTIAIEGSIAKASKVLRLGQPTLSAQLRQLEDKLGIKLFDRQHKKLILTEHGRVALEYSQEIFKIGSEMVEVLHDRKKPERTHVQLGAIDSVPKHLIARFVHAAYRVAPCSVSVLEGSSADLLRELTAHRIDLVLTNHPPVSTEGARFKIRTLGQFPVLVCGAERFKPLKKGFPKSLDGQPFVLPTSHSKLRHDVDHYMDTRGIQPDVVAETQDTSLQKLLGVKGLGLLPISFPAESSFLSKGELIEIGRLDGVLEELLLISSTRKIENPISSHLMRTFAFGSSKA